MERTVSIRLEAQTSIQGSLLQDDNAPRDIGLDDAARNSRKEDPYRAAG